MDRPSQKRGDHAGDHVTRRIGDGRVGYCGLCGKVVEIEKTMNGTDLYRRIISYEYRTDEQSDLQRKVWSPTPWVVNVFEGRNDDMMYFEIGEWCRENIGPESSPIHEMQGEWRRGGATVDGWTWYGFATEEIMNRFLEAWPQESRVGKKGVLPEPAILSPIPDFTG